MDDRRPLRPADTSLDSYQRMADAAKARADRQKALDHADAVARGELPELCRIGDGNPTAPGTGLCADCLARPYGEPGELVTVDDGLCKACWTPHVVWLGNVWAKQPTDWCGSPLRCEHECHDDEVWLA